MNFTNAQGRFYSVDVDWVRLEADAVAYHVAPLLYDLVRIGMLPKRVEKTPNGVSIVMEQRPVLFESDAHFQHLSYYRNYEGSKTLNETVDAYGAALDWDSPGTACVFVRNTIQTAQGGTERD